MKPLVVFADPNEPLGALFRDRCAAHADRFEIAFGDVDITPDRLRALLANASLAVVDHTNLPAPLAARCPRLKHVVFLGTGARSYMNPEALAALGIEVHTIKGYGDTAVAEATLALLWAGARRLASMDRAMRAGQWLRTDAMQLTGKTLGLIGFGGIAAEVARLGVGIGMRVLAWNRTPKLGLGVEFVELDHLLAASDAVSMHLLLTDETRGFLSQGRIAAMKHGAILVNTARGALVEEAAMVDALRTGQLSHAALDVFDIEPLPPGHVLTTLENVTLCAHSAFRTPEANANLIDAAVAHAVRLTPAPEAFR